MAHIPLDPDHLRVRDPLPFGVYDGNGMLLLPAGGVITDEGKLTLLRGKHLLVDADESARWRESYVSSVDRLIFNNARLEKIAVGRISQERSARTVAARESGSAGNPSLVEQWEQLMRTLAAALRDAHRDPLWLQRAQAAYERGRALAARREQVAYLLLVQHTLHGHDHYSAFHAMLCALVCERVSALMGWSAEDGRTLGHAALTMNVAMTRLQDNLQHQRLPLTPEQRTQIEQHGMQGAAMLAAAGVTDARWLKVVRLHHDPSLHERPISQLDAGGRLARLLSVVDRHTAKISHRASRAAMSPLAAMRDACAGAEGQPDEYGSALLKVLGMYPPGVYVSLANGEQGVVVGGGRRTNEPTVASLVGSSGLPLTPPVLRDTGSAGRGVSGVLTPSDVRVRLNLEQVVALL